MTRIIICNVFYCHLNCTESLFFTHTQNYFLTILVFYIKYTIFVMLAICIYHFFISYMSLLLYIKSSKFLVLNFNWSFPEWPIKLWNFYKYSLKSLGMLCSNFIPAVPSLDVCFVLRMMWKWRKVFKKTTKSEQNCLKSLFSPFWFNVPFKSATIMNCPIKANQLKQLIG